MMYLGRMFLAILNMHVKYIFYANWNFDSDAQPHPRRRLTAFLTAMRCPALKESFDERLAEIPKGREHTVKDNYSNSAAPVGRRQIALPQSRYLFKRPGQVGTAIGTVGSGDVMAPACPKVGLIQFPRCRELTAWGRRLTRSKAQQTSNPVTCGS